MFSKIINRVVLNKVTNKKKYETKYYMTPTWRKRPTSMSSSGMLQFDSIK